MKLLRSRFDTISIDKRFPCLLLLCVSNLLFMHYSFRLSYTDGSEYLIYSYHWVTNFVMTIFDVTLLLLFFLLLTKGRMKSSVCIVFWITLLWSAVNVLYGRFFHQYLPFTAIGEASSVADRMVFNSIISEVHWEDMFYVLMAALFVLTYRKYREARITKKGILVLVIILLTTIVSPYAIYTAYHLANPSSRKNWELYEIRIKSDIFRIMPIKDCFPNAVRFQWGCMIVAAADIYDMMKSQELTKEELNEIAQLGSGERKNTHHERPENIRNVVFIILESFLSAPIDLHVDGQEVTPCLNALKADTSVYYNGQVCPNVTIGESGDGQFIYMTGVLPLRSKVTVGIANSRKMPGLPNILKEQVGIKRTEIVIPGLPTVWRQDEMNVVYGIDHMMSAADYYKQSEITDKEIFNVAMPAKGRLDEPFLSVVLSCSTHMPYAHDIDATFTIKDPSLPDSYKHYLNACHYADAQIGRYLDELKNKGLYDNSLIIIAADHDAHLNLLGMEGRIERHLPLYIIHGNIDNATCWQGACNQLDVYTTLLDLLGIESDWYGLGQSLLSPDYSNIIDGKKWEVSERIIRGDYFSK